jgi:hypothetical protein
VDVASRVARSRGETPAKQSMWKLSPVRGADRFRARVAQLFANHVFGATAIVLGGATALLDFAAKLAQPLERLRQCQFVALAIRCPEESWRFPITTIGRRFSVADAVSPRAVLRREHGPSLGDEQSGFGRGELEGLADSVPRHVDPVDLLGYLADQSDSDACRPI